MSKKAKSAEFVINLVLFVFVNEKIINNIKKFLKFFKYIPEKYILWYIIKEL